MDEKKSFLIFFSVVVCGVGISKYLTKSNEKKTLPDIPDITKKNNKPEKLFDFSGLSTELHKHGTLKLNQNLNQNQNQN